MPVLKNPKHERFAQLVAQGANYTQAAKVVGYSELRAGATGSNLAKKRNIADRIAELSARVAEQSVSISAVNRAWIMERLQEIAIKATAKEDFAPANRALELLGKENGMFVDRKDIKLSKTIEEMTDDELVTILAESGSRADTPAESIN